MEETLYPRLGIKTSKLSPVFFIQLCSNSMVGRVVLAHKQRVKYDKKIVRGLPCSRHKLCILMNDKVRI